MRSSTPIRVVLTEQHWLLLRALRIILADPAQFTIGAVQNADALHQQVATTPCDIRVVDPAPLPARVPTYPGASSSSLAS